MEEPGANLRSAIVFLLLVCGSASAGFFINSRLPERHRSRETLELVQLAITLLVTFTAIVLGLLTTSVKAGFDEAYNARGDYAGQLAQMDRCLRDYGPETAHIREQLRGYVAAVIASTWPSETPPANVTYPDTSKMPLTGESSVLASLMNDVGLETRSLQPADALQRTLASVCSQQFHDLIKARWKSDRRRASLNFDALLLGARVLVRDPVRELWRRCAAQRSERDRRLHVGHRDFRGDLRHS